MRTSIKSKLFLFAYGTVLFLILGIIVLNNTFLERYYIKSRQQSLIEAFTEIKIIDLNEADFADAVFEIEEAYSIDVHILAESESLGDETPVYLWIYGRQMPHNDLVIGSIIEEFRSQNEGTSEKLVSPVDLGDANYKGYLMEIESLLIPGRAEDTSMFSFCVATGDVNEPTYYILTITIASVRENIAIFNTFTILVGFVFMIVSGLVMYFISYSFTNPILEITQVAKNIAGLNFENKVKLAANDELGDLGASINQMSVQLESAIKDLKSANLKLSADIELKEKVDAMRKGFIANASHELKTPLALIMGYCEAMKLPGLSDKTAEEYLDIIMDESSKMNKLVMALLEISQLESGMMDIQRKRFSIKDLIEDTIRLFIIMFEEQNIKPEIEIEDAVIESDYDHLQTVLSNFIANALHHVDERIIIRISTFSSNEKSLKVAVYNSGNKIPESEIDRIWDSFYKLDKARTRSYGGHGLGLSIAKTILENLGCAYGVVNKTEGVEFYFEIPVHQDN